MSAEEVVARALYDHNWADPDNPANQPPGDETQCCARAALNALAAAGFAVVELPEATGDYDTGLEFSDGSVAGTVLAGAGMVHHGGWEWTPDQARDVAAVWLAAAVAAAGGVVEP